MLCNASQISTTSVFKQVIQVQIQHKRTIISGWVIGLLFGGIHPSELELLDKLCIIASSITNNVYFFKRQKTDREKLLIGVFQV